MDRSDQVNPRYARHNPRYARQAVLAEIGPAGQQRLAEARVLVVGAGGLGSYVLQALAGAGVGHLAIIDHDRVDLSNLHRQPLFRMNDIGRPKAEAAAEAVRALNPEVESRTSVERLQSDNADRFVEQADLVVDAADSLAVTYILSDACMMQAKPLVSASVLEQRGYVGAFCGGAPSYRAVFPDMPTVIGSCAQNGVFGSAVGVLGSLQAHIVLQLILGHHPSPLGRLVTVDLKSLSFGGFDFSAAEEPTGTPIPFISLANVERADLVVELRDESEAPQPVTAEALRILPADIGSAELPHDRRVVLCCRSGIRAFRAANVLRRRGFDRLAVLAAGE
ncbi:HesA/MoeB/ThiF family protein [Rhodoligotrophos defluvii]|uniref:HesA/MoeB/ThiF family protein n=1 Tax=Rhodoligotrophos defluvii TaxID=2561934 RepID=UPI0010C9BE0D|nr:HesA/MoeB/ThiF family protein [Rhodoligotrophos defluvii]